MKDENHLSPKEPVATLDTKKKDTIFATQETW